MRKTIAMLLTAVMSVSLLAGCGKSDAPKTEDTNKNETQTTEKTDDTSNGKKIDIRVTRWGSLEEFKADTKLIEEFNANNDKNINIIYDVVPGEGYGDRLTTSFSSGDGYDVFLSGEGDFFKWVDKSLTYPMDELIANDTEYKQTLSDSLMQMGNINGKQHYMVAGQNPICLYYNRDMFDKAGLEYPSDDWTWDDLFAAAEKLTVKDDKGNYESYGFNAQSWDYAVLTYLESLGLGFMSEDGATAEGYLNSPEVAAALDKYFSMSSEPNKVSPASADLDTFGSSTAMMINNKLGMFISGGWDVTPLREAGINYGTAVIPGNHKSYVCAAGFAIGANTKNPEAAWEVVKLLSGEEAASLREELENALPTTEEGMAAFLETQDERDHGLIKTLTFGVQPIGMRSVLGSQINQLTANIFERIIYKDGTTQEILDDALAELK